MPEPVAPGAAVRAGMLNLSGPLEVRADALGEDTLLREIARLVETAERSRGRYASLADRASRAYSPVVYLLALAALLGWGLATHDWRLATNIAAAVLIVTCPCGLGLAVPAVLTAASGPALPPGRPAQGRRGAGEARHRRRRRPRQDRHAHHRPAARSPTPPPSTPPPSPPPPRSPPAAATPSPAPSPAPPPTAGVRPAPVADIAEHPGLGAEGTLDGRARPARPRRMGGRRRAPLDTHRRLAPPRRRAGGAAHLRRRPAPGGGGDRGAPRRRRACR